MNKFFYTLLLGAVFSGNALAAYVMDEDASAVDPKEEMSFIEEANKEVEKRIPKTP